MNVRGSGTRRLAALIAAAAVAGCAPDIEEPTVEIVGVRGGSIGLDGGELLLSVRVDNPNEFAIEASRLDYDLDIRRDDRWFDLAEGVLEEGLVVAGYGTTSVEIPVSFRLDDAIRVGADLLRGGTPTFRVSGRVDLQRPVRRRLPYRQEVTADLGARTRGDTVP